ncbi:MAG: hypothetical protein R3F29_07410 [Planctomycetota bacterium]
MRKMLAALLSVMAAPLSAQDPQQRLDTLLLPEIEQRLASENAADVAWGGYLVHRYRLRRAQRAVSKALAHWRTIDSDEARLVRLHLLDGLIGSEALIPADQVEFLLDDALTRGGAFVLIARQPHSSSELLERIAMRPAPAGDLVRSGAARVLLAAGIRVDGMAKSLLVGFSPEFVVDVGEASPQEVDVVAWEQLFAPGMGRRLGFPPLVKLRLASAADVETLERTVAPAVGTELPLVLVRKENAQFNGMELQLGEPAAWSNHERSVLLQAMVGVAVPDRLTVLHAFRGADRYLAEIVPLRDAQLRDAERLVAALRGQGWLKDDELPDYRVRVETRVHDNRHGESARLPELPPPTALGR